MPSKTEKDLWVEMSIREIWTQAHFAEIAYSHVDPKATCGNDAVFSSIHSFLSHCAIVSKMLSAKYDNNAPHAIGDILGVLSSSIIHTKTFRNHLEHYDERLRRWIGQHGVNIIIGDYNIVPKSAINIPNMVFVRHYDPSTGTFTFVNDDFDLRALSDEVQRIKVIASKWVEEMERKAIVPPFI